jgi:hypothetical protein
MRTDPSARGPAPARERRAAWLAGLCASAAVALSGVFPVNNSDTYGHLAQGRQIAELGRVPSHDTLSFFKAEPQPWRNYEWLSDFIGWLLYDAGGPNALIALKCATLALAAALLTGLGYRLGGPRSAAVAAVLIVVAIPASRFRFTERPHLVALPFAVLYLFAFAHLLRAGNADIGARSRKDAAWIAALFGMHVLWVNLHGSHLLGLMLTVVHLVLGFGLREARGKLVAVFGLQLLASCISPYGPAIVTDALAHTFDPEYRLLVTEWEPWQPSDPPWLLGAPVLQTLLLAAVVRPLWRRGPAHRALLTTTCVVGLASFRSIRFVAEYLMLSAPAIAIGFGDALRRAAWPVFRLRASLSMLGALLCAAWGAPRMPPYAALSLGESEVGLPAASGHWLAHNARAPRVLAAVEDSWYLMWKVPQARFLVDGRVPFLGPAHIVQVSEAMANPAALGALLARFGVDTVVVRHTFEPQRNLLTGMRARADYALVSIEDRYSLFVRTDIALLPGAEVRPLVLEPAYELPWLLSAGATRERAIRDELSRLPPHENRRGYTGWVRAVLALKPLLRAGGRNGLRAPANAAELAALELAQRRLARAGVGAEGVPVVHAYHALVAIARCDFGAAERALATARWEGESRETLLGAQELALRMGRHEQVIAFLQEAEVMPGAEGDAWLEALREGLRTPPRCP